MRTAVEGATPGHVTHRPHGMALSPGYRTRKSSNYENDDAVAAGSSGEVGPDGTLGVTFEKLESAPDRWMTVIPVER